eukprot:TRINITY_DN17972_c0_g1_i2.p1 TRINITY_DN17972_c0_g1~~TRINITY_DN17972_c0_g1_i2.p1  ORF type:complete len:471 (-),score=89.32 TRINITY_DN17972_c0_g1_i2:559-1971(-)
MSGAVMASTCLGILTFSLLVTAGQAANADEVCSTSAGGEQTCWAGSSVVDPGQLLEEIKSLKVGCHDIEGEGADKPLVPPLSPRRVAFLAAAGVTLRALMPTGAEVIGFDLKKTRTPLQVAAKKAVDQNREPYRHVVALFDKDYQALVNLVLDILEAEMACRGFLVFKQQGVLSGDQQNEASALFGAKELHSTHGVHPKAPNRHIFRLSNLQAEGTLGVGPQWHNDGSFEEHVFSHVAYHIVSAPKEGGETEFAHQGGAFDSLPLERQAYWRALVSVNSNSGVLHPAVHKHPCSGRESVWLHLGMTGGIIQESPKDSGKWRLLPEAELRTVFHEYNDLMNAGTATQAEAAANATAATKLFGLTYHYEPGDFIVIDNWAVSHRASASAHELYKPRKTSKAEQTVPRILHRTTIKSKYGAFSAGRGLPGTVTQKILESANSMTMKTTGKKEQGVWVPGGLGYRWDESIHMQN